MHMHINEPGRNNGTGRVEDLFAVARNEMIADFNHDAIGIRTSRNASSGPEGSTTRPPRINI